MDISNSLQVLSALGQELRMNIVCRLVADEPQGLVAGDLAALLKVRQNTLSSALGILEAAGLVNSQREGRHIRYRARLDTIESLAAFLLADCCGGRPEHCNLPSFALSAKAHPMTERPYNVLFLCTGNSARSILAESILNSEGNGRFKAYSAGSRPAGQVNPFAIALLDKLHKPTDFARSKSWEEFASPDAPNMDFVFTVCDDAAKEECPIWPGHPATAHWGVPDPAAIAGSDTDKALAFAEAYRLLDRRIKLFLSLPMSSLDRLALKTELDAIGHAH